MEIQSKHKSYKDGVDVITSATIAVKTLPLDNYETSKLNNNGTSKLNNELVMRELKQKIEIKGLL